MLLLSIDVVFHTFFLVSFMKALTEVNVIVLEQLLSRVSCLLRNCDGLYFQLVHGRGSAGVIPRARLVCAASVCGYCVRLLCAASVCG